MTEPAEKPKRKNKNDFQAEGQVLREAIIGLFPVTALLSVLFLMEILEASGFHYHMITLLIASSLISFVMAVLLFFHWQMWRIQAIADGLLILFVTGIGAFMVGLAIMIVHANVHGFSFLLSKFGLFCVIASPLLLILLWQLSKRLPMPVKPRFIKPNMILLLVVVSPFLFIIALLTEGPHIISEVTTSEHIYLMYDYESSSDGHYSGVYECNSLGFQCTEILDFRGQRPELVKGEHDNVLVLVNGEVVFDSSEDGEQ